MCTDEDIPDVEYREVIPNVSLPMSGVIQCGEDVQDFFTNQIELIYPVALLINPADGCYPNCSPIPDGPLQLLIQAYDNVGYILARFTRSGSVVR
jgi:hypothetical protein